MVQSKTESETRQSVEDRTPHPPTHPHSHPDPHPPPPQPLTPPLPSPHPLTPPLPHSPTPSHPHLPIFTPPTPYPLTPTPSHLHLHPRTPPAPSHPHTPLCSTCPADHRLPTLPRQEVSPGFCANMVTWTSPPTTGILLCACLFLHTQLLETSTALSSGADSIMWEYYTSGYERRISP